MSSSEDQSDPDPDQVTVQLDGPVAAFCHGALQDAFPIIAPPGDGWEIVGVHVTFCRTGAQAV